MNASIRGSLFWSSCTIAIILALVAVARAASWVEHRTPWFAIAAVVTLVSLFIFATIHVIRMGWLDCARV